MDSPVSAQEPEHEQPVSPRRLSALYQYHNAPEVAPAHGLEYDDTIYPVSDKMTLVREFPLFRRHHDQQNHAGQDPLGIENRPPRIIFGMKIGTFLIVAVILLLVVVGAAVGGAVGGKDLHQGLPSSATYAPISKTTSTTTSQTPTTTIVPYSAPTPTYTPLSSCPKANSTIYDSGFSITAAETDIGNQTFSMYCDLVPSETIQKISGAFVYSFSDCADVCASFNFANDSLACNVAYYEPEGRRPINCWIAATETIITSLELQRGTDIAVLIPPI